MIIDKCKWYNNVSSPVVFMIDDLANVWIDTSGSGVCEAGEDWGYMKRSDNSSILYLEQELLVNFLQIKTTFFIPVGIRAGVIQEAPMNFISKMINEDEDSKKFFKSLYNDPRYEMAYHGTTHGKPGLRTEDFIQEWDSFRNIEEAVQVVNLGKDIYKDVFGEYPRGGKYCGYISNSFSDDSIDSTGFMWWCRYCNLGIVENKDPKFSGEDDNPITNYDIKFFGKNKVVDIPSTVVGSYLNSIINLEGKPLKKILKKLFYSKILKSKLKNIDFLLENKLVIAICEHIAPSRVDGLRQKPNIFDDKKGLQVIFSYLKNKNVWYCTCSELAKYVIARENTEINMINSNSFELKKLNKSIGNSEVLTITIKDCKANLIKLPNGIELQVIDNIVNIPLINGKYELIWG